MRKNTFELQFSLDFLSLNLMGMGNKFRLKYDRVGVIYDFKFIQLESYLLVQR